MSEPQVKLPRHADELLRDFPMTEPDFEAQAQAIAARLQAPASSGALSDEALFKTPDLAAEAAEPPLPSQVRAAPKGSLADRARRSLHQPADDSAALAKELLAAAAQSRRPNAELAARMRAASKSSPTSTPLPSSEPRRERHSGVVNRKEAAKPSPVAALPAAASRDKRGAIIAFVGVAVAAAASVVLFSREPQTSSPLAAQRAADARDVSAPTGASPVPVATASPREDGVLSPEALQRAPAPAVEAAAPRAADGAASRSLKAGAAARPAATAAAPPARAEVVQLAEDAAPEEAAPAKPKEELAPELALRPAQGSSGSVPLSPSAGAVGTALGSVRSGAQACLAGQTQPVTATVTFASDGHVLRVSAGGPSGACIQAALSKAHIAPFAKESFSATTTIRPP